MATQSLVFLLLGVQIAFVLGLYQLRDYGCPKVALNPNTPRCGHECFDCFFGQEVCCPNDCGGYSCMGAVPVKNCTVGNKTIEHGGYIREVEHTMNNLCGDCLCDDGSEHCFFRSCDGAIP